MAASGLSFPVAPVVDSQLKRCKQRKHSVGIAGVVTNFCAKQSVKLVAV